MQTENILRLVLTFTALLVIIALAAMHLLGPVILANLIAVLITLAQATAPTKA